MMTLQEGLATSCSRDDFAGTQPRLAVPSPVLFFFGSERKSIDDLLCSLITATIRSAGSLCLSAVPSLKESRQHEILGTIVSLMVISIVAVGMRIMSRRISAAGWGWDDGLICLALVFTLGLNIDSLVGLGFGYGLHMVRLSLDEAVEFAKVRALSRMKTWSFPLCKETRWKEKSS